MGASQATNANAIFRREKWHFDESFAPPVIVKLLCARGGHFVVCNRAVVAVRATEFLPLVGANPVFRPTGTTRNVKQACERPRSGPVRQDKSIVISFYAPDRSLPLASGPKIATSATTTATITTVPDSATWSGPPE